MGIYDGFHDSPNQIKSEGQQIDLAFVRNGDGTGIIKWNIPVPVAGCSVEDQAYDGIVILVSDKPANYIESSPKNETYYSADPTFDPELHAGDKIDDSRVVGAFYHDKITKTLLVQNVLEKTPYYVSAYAVDNVGRYHREGVHAYSLPTGPDEYNSSVDTPARYDIGLDLNPVENSTITGLVDGTEYNFKIIINGTEYEIEIDGADALTYGDLVTAVNEEFKLITDAESKDLNAIHYYFDSDNNKLYKWNFDQYEEIDVIINSADLTIPVLGSYWYDGEILYVYESGGWATVPLLKLSYDPVNPTCDALWFDGTNAWIWENSHWCKLVTYIQSTSPLLPPVMSCDDYWYDIANFILYGWDLDKNGWEENDVIYSSIDPNIIGVGDYWYNQNNLEMKVLVNSIWENLVNIEYSERNEAGTLDSPVGNQYWYIPSEQLFYRRNSTNTEWINLDFILSPSDPTDRKSCDLWWNSLADELYTWDELSSSWILVNSFVQSSIDPSNPPELENDSAWYNPDTEKLQLLTTVDCKFKDAEYIDYPSDPTLIGDGVGWLNSDNEFKVSNGIGGWVDIIPIIATTDPYIININDFWYNTSVNLLYQWDGSTWIEIDTVDSLFYPEINLLVLNTVDDKLYIWNGITWIDGDSIAEVILINPNTSTERNSLCFITSAVGCTQSIRIVIEAGNLFTQLGTTVIYYDPVNGASRLEKGPSYLALGIGDDGSPDERRNLHRIIRQKLGHPTQKVELTDDQIDEAINSALIMVRKYSGYGYHRTYFFLDLKPNQQRYILTNRCVGFNKITGINYIYRLRSGFLNGVSRGAYDIFGYQALVHLYRTGTFDMLSYHLVSAYTEDLQIMFADHITFDWVENTRELKLYHTVYGPERVLLDTYIECTEQEIFSNRETVEWVKRWSLAESKMMLSQIRGKFQTLPGPQGSTTLNSQELITQAESEISELKLELEDASMQNLEEAGMGAHFILG
jgi:hypothetical protein